MSNRTIIYTLNDVEQRRLDEFMAERKAQLLEEQRKAMSPEDFEYLTAGGKFPYLGAIGGGVTYHLTPNSIGMGISVTYAGVERDITDFDSW